MVPFQIHCIGGLRYAERSRMAQVMCLKESRKLLAYLEKEFGKAQLGFQLLFLVVHGLQLVYSISKTLLQSRRTTINASSRAISIGCH